jgi:hypothetical protein
MNLRQLYARLSEVQDSSVVTLTAPIPLVVGSADGMAAKLLLWLVDELPPTATNKDLEDVLHAAVWWNTFLLAMQYAEKEGNIVE